MKIASRQKQVLPAFFVLFCLFIAFTASLTVAQEEVDYSKTWTEGHEAEWLTNMNNWADPQFIHRAENHLYGKTSFTGNDEAIAQKYLSTVDFSTEKHKTIAKNFFIDAARVNDNAVSFSKYAQAEGVSITFVEGAGNIKSYSKDGWLEGADGRRINIIEWKEEYKFSVDEKGNIKFIDKAGAEHDFTGEIKKGTDGRIELADGQIDGKAVKGGEGITVEGDEIKGKAERIDGVTFEGVSKFVYKKDTNALVTENTKIAEISESINIHGKNIKLPEGSTLHSGRLTWHSVQHITYEANPKARTKFSDPYGGTYEVTELTDYFNDLGDHKGNEHSWIQSANHDLGLLKIVAKNGNSISVELEVDKGKLLHKYRLIDVNSIGGTVSVHEGRARTSVKSGGKPKGKGLKTGTTIVTAGGYHIQPGGKARKCELACHNVIETVFIPEEELSVEKLEKLRYDLKLRLANAKSKRLVDKIIELEEKLSKLTEREQYAAKMEQVTTKLSRLGVTKGIVSLVEGLQDPSFDGFLAKFLLEKGARETVVAGERKKIETAILSALYSKDPVVRGAAIDLAGRLRSKEAVQALIAATKEPDAGIRKSAIIALGRLAAQKAVTDLIAALQKDTDVKNREAAADALGSIGSKEAKSALKQAMKDKDKDKRVREAAAEAYSRVKEEGKVRRYFDMVLSPGREFRHTPVSRFIEWAEREGITSEDVHYFLDRVDLKKLRTGTERDKQMFRQAVRLHNGLLRSEALTTAAEVVERQKFMEEAGYDFGADFDAKMKVLEAEKEKINSADFAVIRAMPLSQIQRSSEALMEELKSNEHMRDSLEQWKESGIKPTKAQLLVLSLVSQNFRSGSPVIEAVKETILSDHETQGVIDLSNVDNSDVNFYGKPSKENCEEGHCSVGPKEYEQTLTGIHYHSHPIRAGGVSETDKIMASRTNYNGVMCQGPELTCTLYFPYQKTPPIVIYSEEK